MKRSLYILMLLCVSWTCQLSQAMPKQAGTGEVTAAEGSWQHAAAFMEAQSACMVAVEQPQLWVSVSQNSNVQQNNKDKRSWMRLVSNTASASPHPSSFSYAGVGRMVSASSDNYVITLHRLLC